MRVIVSGLTAAGKTTHSRRVADALGAEWFGARTILQSLTGTYGEPPNSLWLSAAGNAIEAARDSDSTIDRKLDQATIDRLLASEHVVADSWALPWLALPPDIEVIRVWLESSVTTRVMKCIVSHLSDRELTEREASELVNTKDIRTRDRFTAAHGFDLFADRAPFDVILNNSRFITRASADSATRGIEAFAPIFDAAVRTAAGSPSPSDTRTLRAAPADVVVRLSRDTRNVNGRK